MELPYQSDPQTRRQKINCKPELIIASLQRFYATNPFIAKVMPYLTGDADISLRIIDWFVTKFSRKNFTSYELNGQRFVVYKSYKGQLDAYNKQYFDTNCRRERIQFGVDGYTPFVTTIGKLNFFRWALESNLLDYIEANQEALKAGYNQFLKESTQSQKKLRQETATSTTSTVSANSIVSADVAEAESVVLSNTLIPAASGKGTRRRRTKQSASSLKQLQINTTNYVELTFD
jgi:hypothetical protein